MLKLAVDGFEQIDERLKVILYAIAGFCRDKYGKDIVITSLIRPESTGVHKYKRGADMRTYGFFPKQLDEIAEWTNKHFIYDHQRSQFKTLVDEREPNPFSDDWTGPHFHIQVNPLGRTILYV